MPEQAKLVCSQVEKFLLAAPKVCLSHWEKNPNQKNQSLRPSQEFWVFYLSTHAARKTKNEKREAEGTGWKRETENCNLNNFQSFNSTYETARGHIDFTLDAKKINFAERQTPRKTNSCRGSRYFDAYDRGWRRSGRTEEGRRQAAIPKPCTYCGSKYCKWFGEVPKTRKKNPPRVPTCRRKGVQRGNVLVMSIQCA